jgi:hypothetical protein
MKEETNGNMRREDVKPNSTDRNDEAQERLKFNTVSWNFIIGKTTKV